MNYPVSSVSLSPPPLCPPATYLSQLCLTPLLQILQAAGASGNQESQTLVCNRSSISAVPHSSLNHSFPFLSPQLSTRPSKNFPRRYLTALPMGSEKAMWAPPKYHDDIKLHKGTAPSRKSAKFVLQSYSILWHNCADESMQLVTEREHLGFDCT